MRKKSNCTWYIRQARGAFIVHKLRMGKLVRGDILKSARGHVSEMMKAIMVLNVELNNRLVHLIAL